MPQCPRQISCAARLLRVEALLLDSATRLGQVSRLLLDARRAVARAQGHGVSLRVTAASRESKLLAALWSRAFILRGETSGFYETMLSLRSYVSCALTHWSALSAHAPCGGPALESAWPSGIDTLGFDASFERCIRHNTTCFTLHTTPIAFCSLAFCSIQPLMTGTIRPSACPLCIYLWRGVLERWPHVACF